MKRYCKRVMFLTSVISFLAIVSACSTAPKSMQGKADIETDAAAVLAKAQRNDPTLAKKIDESAGYAVFPSVGKGGAGLGGAYGKGVLYKQGVAVGYCDLSQATIGLQLGGQSFSEVITFENKQAVESFMEGRFGFDAQATAVALKSGAAANAKARNGATVFTMNETGLMLEAAVGGQKFSYQDK